jgi:urease accessory protein
LNRSLALLAALQLGDSIFPTGSFTLSHGLETLADRGLIRTPTELRTWLETTLRWQVAPSDGVAAATAWSCHEQMGELAAIEDRLVSLKLAREPREASLRAGRQLLRVVAAFAGDSLQPVRQAVAEGRLAGYAPLVLGIVGRLCGLDRRAAVLLLLHQYVSTILGAALRSIDLDHVEAQRIRFELAPALVAGSELSLSLGWEEMYTCVPQTELMAMLHERAEVRLFAT